MFEFEPRNGQIHNSPSLHLFTQSLIQLYTTNSHMCHKVSIIFKQRIFTKFKNGSGADVRTRIVEGEGLRMNTQGVKGGGTPGSKSQKGRTNSRIPGIVHRIIEWRTTLRIVTLGTNQQTHCMHCVLLVLNQMLMIWNSSGLVDAR